jgi:hypothetical protein
MTVNVQMNQVWYFFNFPLTCVNESPNKTTFGHDFSILFKSVAVLINLTTEIYLKFDLANVLNSWTVEQLKADNLPEAWFTRLLMNDSCAGINNPLKQQGLYIDT